MTDQSNISSVVVEASALAKASNMAFNSEKPVVSATVPSDDAVAAPALSDTTVSSTHSSASNEDRQLQEVKDFAQPQPAQVLTLLARQLEYYFSSRNLSKDTYLQTLRNLNDGCVPVNILANFSKVKAIVASADEECRFHAILQAATEYSELLQVNSIETATGKIATDDTPSSATTILAVGPIGKEALVLSEEVLKKSQSTVSITSTDSKSEKTSNTIILREVHPDVTEEDIRELFTFEGCPPIECVRPDVAFCWFVTLDAEDRSDMLRVMMRIRMMTLGGDFVQARLKATASASVDSVPPMNPSLDFLPVVSTIQNTDATKKKKKKKSKKGKKKIPAKQQQKGSVGNKAVTPPSLGEDDFPSLLVTNVEYDAMPKLTSEEDESKKSSTSLLEVKSAAALNPPSPDSTPKTKTLGCYAAALLKASPLPTSNEKPSPKRTQPVKRLPTSSTEEQEESDGTKDAPAASQDPITHPMVTAPTWVRGRSFADVMRA